MDDHEFHSGSSGSTANVTLAMAVVMLVLADERHWNSPPKRGFLCPSYLWGSLLSIVFARRPSASPPATVNAEIATCKSNLHEGRQNCPTALHTTIVLVKGRMCAENKRQPYSKMVRSHWIPSSPCLAWIKGTYPLQPCQVQL